MPKIITRFLWTVPDMLCHSCHSTLFKTTPHSETLIIHLSFIRIDSLWYRVKRFQGRDNFNQLSSLSRPFFTLLLCAQNDDESSTFIVQNYDLCIFCIVKKRLIKPSQSTENKLIIFLSLNSRWWMGSAVAGDRRISSINQSIRTGEDE